MVLRKTALVFAIAVTAAIGVVLLIPLNREQPKCSILGRNCSGLKVHAMGIDVVKNLTGRSIRGAMDGSGAIEAKVF
jgi:hypothetical protein